VIVSDLIRDMATSPCISYGVIMKPVRSLLFFVLILLTWRVAVKADYIPARILQVKLGQVYFSVGEEADILPGSRYVITCNDSQKVIGYIERALPGLSYGFMSSGDLSEIVPEECFAVLEQAATADSGEVRLSTDIALQQLVWLPIATTRSPGIDSQSAAYQSFNWNVDSMISPHEARISQLFFTVFPSSAEMTLNYLNRKFDGYLCYLPPGPLTESEKNSSLPAPYIACLLPNWSHISDKGAAVTTSLYYLLDDNRLSLIFNSGHALPVPGFTNPSLHSTRYYPFDATKGHLLLQQTVGRRGRIALYTSVRQLDGLPRYFSDVLAREHFRVRIVGNRKDADALFEFVPFDRNNPAVAFEFLVRQLARDTLPGSSAAEALRAADLQLSWLRAETDQGRRLHLIRSLEQRLIDDLGVFPLFQPTLFFALRRNVRGISINDGSLLLLNNPRKLFLPAKSEEGLR